MVYTGLDMPKRSEKGMETKPSIRDIRDRIIGSVHPDIRVGRAVPERNLRLHQDPDSDRKDTD